MKQTIETIAKVWLDNRGLGEFWYIEVLDNKDELTNCEKDKEIEIVLNYKPEYYCGGRVDSKTGEKGKLKKWHALSEVLKKENFDNANSLRELIEETLEDILCCLTTFDGFVTFFNRTSKTKKMIVKENHHWELLNTDRGRYIERFVDVIDKVICN